jgi:hypothetical protein
VHPQMWLANSNAAPSLLEILDNPQLTWPTVYPAMDLIANRKTGRHFDWGGAITFYDHLISFGQNHGAKLVLHDFDAHLAYQPGTSVLFSGTALAHSVSKPRGEKNSPERLAEGENLPERLAGGENPPERLEGGENLPEKLAGGENQPERLAIAHYAKDGIQDRVGVARPLLPTQLGWWNGYAAARKT